MASHNHHMFSLEIYYILLFLLQFWKLIPTEKGSFDDQMTGFYLIQCRYKARQFNSF